MRARRHPQRGRNRCGFYRDFALAGTEDAYALPVSVSDEAAFLIDAVAMAEHVVDELHISIGQHVLVMGGGLYGNVLCQILIYHRAVPILADNNAERLSRAKKSGIYYTYPNDETLKEHILQVTGGKLADAAVYLAFANKSEPSTLFSLVARGAYVAYCAPWEKISPSISKTRSKTISPSRALRRAGNSFPRRSISSPIRR